jgi:polyisoprenoid-binding protein YceI
MKPFTLAALALLLPSAVLPSAVLAQHQTFALNPNTSDVHITLNTTHEVVHGTFHLQSGSIDFDPTTPQLTGSVIVASGSGKTGNDTRDKKMNKNILQVDQFTTISFEPKSYTGTLTPTGDSTLQVKGIFKLLGTPHEITIPMQVHLDPTSAIARSHFTIPYVQWGLKNPSFLIWKADNDVTIDLVLNGHLTR